MSEITKEIPVASWALQCRGSKVRFITVNKSTVVLAAGICRQQREHPAKAEEIP